MNHIEKEKLIKADIASIENRVRHAFNQGYDLGYKEGTKRAKSQEQEPTTKNNLGVDCIDRAELLKAMDTWDKFGYTETGCFVREPKGNYVPYVHYEDMVNCVKGMPSVIPEK